MKQVQNYSQGPKFLSVVSKFPSCTVRCLTSHLGHFSGQAAHRPPLAQMTHTCARPRLDLPAIHRSNIYWHPALPGAGAHTRRESVCSQSPLCRGDDARLSSDEHNADSSNLAEALWEHLGGEGPLPRPGSIQNWTLEVEQNF